MAPEAANTILDRDTVEQLVIENMTFGRNKGMYLSRKRIDFWICELFKENGIPDTPEQRQLAFEQINPAIQSLGYIPVRNGYKFSPPQGSE